MKNNFLTLTIVLLMSLTACSSLNTPDQNDKKAVHVDSVTQSKPKIKYETLNGKHVFTLSTIYVFPDNSNQEFADTNK